MNYEQMSDFEVNKLVADSRWPEFVKYEQYGKLRIQVPDGDDFILTLTTPPTHGRLFPVMLSI